MSQEQTPWGEEPVGNKEWIAGIKRAEKCVQFCAGLNPEGIPDAVKALDELLNRGGRLIRNDGREWLTIPRKEAVDAARAALKKVKR